MQHGKSNLISIAGTLCGVGFCGSLYLIAERRDLLMQRNTDCGGQKLELVSVSVSAEVCGFFGGPAVVTADMQRVSMTMKGKICIFTAAPDLM